jgi:hypothetical protein
MIEYVNICIKFRLFEAQTVGIVPNTQSQFFDAPKSMQPQTQSASRDADC